MNLPTPSGFVSLEGISAWARRLLAAIVAAWAREHRTDGTHAFPVVDVPFLPGIYSGANAMTWTVDPTDQKTLQYRIVDGVMTLSWKVLGSDVGGTPTNELRIAIPDGYRAVEAVTNPHWYADAGTEGVGFAGVLLNDTFVRLYRLGSVGWTATTGDNTATAGQLSFRVQRS